MLTLERIKSVLNECTGLEAEVADNKVKVIPTVSGYLTPISSIELAGDNLILNSSPLTNTEWWQAIMPVSLCPRYMGIMDIKDEYTEACLEKKCEEACQAEDDFVELRASRLRFHEDSEIIAKKFPRLSLFVERTNRLIAENNITYSINISLNTDTSFPYLTDTIAGSDEAVLCSALEAFKNLYTEITGIHGKVDISEIQEMDVDLDPMDEDSLVDEARYYGLIEMVRNEAKDLLAKLMKNKGGEIHENNYVIFTEKLRYVLYANRIEGFKDDLYSGTVYFNKGINEVKNFLVTILGGGRW